MNFSLRVTNNEDGSLKLKYSSHCQTRFLFDDLNIFMTNLRTQKSNDAITALGSSTDSVANNKIGTVSSTN